MSHIPEIVSVNHLRPFMDLREAKLIIEKCIAILQAYDFDAIAFRGLSGALIAPIIAMRMDKSLLAVRKKEEVSHSTHKVEGDAAARRYVIVDDFIATGETVRAILDSVKDFCTYAKCIGVLEAYYLASDINLKKEDNTILVTDIVEDWERKCTCPLIQPKSREEVWTELQAACIRGEWIVPTATDPQP